MRKFIAIGAGLRNIDTHAGLWGWSAPVRYSVALQLSVNHVWFALFKPKRRKQRSVELFLSFTRCYAVTSNFSA